MHGTSALIKIDKKKSFAFDGDHELFLFKVDKFKTFSESNILTFQDLVKSKIILWLLIMMVF